MIMKKVFIIVSIFVVVLCVLVLCLVNYNYLYSLFFLRGADSNSSNEQVEDKTGDYYRDDVYKYKPSDFNMDEVDLPLSEIVEDFRIVKLDNLNDKALIGSHANAFVSESFIGINTSDDYKLFDKTSGRYLRSIGRVGGGPGEYDFVYDHVIDEDNNRIYIVNIMPSSILEYDLNGKFIEKINVPYLERNDGRKFRLTVQDSLMTAFFMSFDGDSIGVMNFNKQGKVISTAPARVFMTGDFSMEVFIENNKVTPIGYSHTASSVYYTYDFEKNELVPMFAFEKGSFPYVYVTDLPNCYIFTLHILQKDDRGDEIFRDSGYVLVDKLSNKKQKVCLKNDFLGGIPYELYFGNGVYTQIIKAYKLREQLKKALKNKGLDDQQRKDLMDLFNSLSDEDNDVVFYGKIKR